MNSFTIAALLIALIGLYAVVSCAVGLRKREFGLRMALGARPLDLISGMMRDFMSTVFAALLLGLLGGWMLLRVLQSQFTGLNADLTQLLVTALVIALTTFLASWLPARRAGRIHPAEALRDG